MASTSSTGIEPGGEQRHLAPRAGVLHFDGLAPGLALAGVDLAQVQHLALHDSAVAAAPVLHHAPVVVGLAVLLASVAAQEHARKFRHPARTAQGPKVSTTAPVATPLIADQQLAPRWTLNSQVVHGNLRKTG
jgi:hypothetical protein